MSLLCVVDDAPYFPIDAYEERRSTFILRGSALVVLALAAHIPALLNHWVWTDQRQILENPLLRSARGLMRFWTHPVASGRSPLGGTVWYCLYLALGASSAFYWHLLSLLAHVGICLLIWAILRRLETPGAWLAAALFAVHPIEVQSVSWVSRQPDVLAALAGLISLLCFLQFKEIHPAAPPDFVVKSPTPGRLRIMTAVWFLCAVLLQPSILALAGVYPLLLWWKKGRLHLSDWLDLAPVLGIAAVTGCIGLLLSELRHDGGPAAALNLLDRLILSGRAIFFYIESIVWPWPLLFVYPRWVVASDWWMLVFPLSLAGAIATLWWKRGELGAGVFVALAAFCIMIFPHLPLLRSEWMGYSFVADHLQYLPGAALLALIAAALARFTDRIKSDLFRQETRFAVGAVLVGGMGTLAFINTRAYSDELKLWKDSLGNSTMSLLARGTLAQYYLEHGQAVPEDLFTREVLDQIDMLKRHGGADAGATVFADMSRAAILDSQKHYSDAIELYQQVLAIDPGNREAALKIAVAYKARGDTAKSLHAFAAACAASPNDEVLLNEYGLALSEGGEATEGILKYRAAIRNNPNYVPAMLNLSNALFARGQYTESAELLHQAVQIDPRNFDAFMNAGAMLFNLRNFPAASRMFEAAVQLRPESPIARDDLGAALAAQGPAFLNEAIDAFTKAVSLKPDFQLAHDHLARARKELDAKNY